MRIALKKFRYLMEAIGPLAPGVGEKELESHHKLQTRPAPIPAGPSV